MTVDRWDRLAARLVMAPPAGGRLTGGEEKILSEGRVRHLILFARNLRNRPAAANLVGRARSLIPGRPLVAVDHEGGIVSFASAIVGSAPSPMLLGSIGDAAYAGRWAESQATHLRSIGINMVNAPLLDLATRSGSRVIGTRSFGEDPALVTRFGLAAMRGYLRGGVIPVIKHFPGHGGVPGDSHAILPVDRRPEAELRRRDLVPYLSTIRSGAPVVMAAHVSFPHLSGCADLPASASPPILNDLLRGELRFGGVVMSDAFDMKGYGGSARAVQSVRAGIDLFCCGSSLAAGARFAARIARALREGEVDRHRVKRSAAAIDELLSIPGRRRKGKDRPAAREADGIAWHGKGRFEPPGGNWHLFLPRRLAGRLSLPLLLEEVRRRRGDAWVRRRITIYPADPGRAAITRIMGKALQYDTVLLGLLGRGELPRGQERLARSLKTRVTRLIHIGLLDPEPLLSCGLTDSLFTFDFRPGTIAALVEVVTGRLSPRGEFPHTNRKPGVRKPARNAP